MTYKNQIIQKILSLSYVLIDLLLFSSIFFLFLLLNISLVLSFIIFVPIFSLVLIFEHYLQKKKLIKYQINLLLLFLYSLHINLSNKKSLYKSINNALKINENRIKNNEINYRFKKIEKELKFHDITNSIRSINKNKKIQNQIYSTNFNLSDILEDIADEYESDLNVNRSVKTIYERLYNNKIDQQNKDIAFIKKFFTLSIVFTTVIPSILLFGFIAYSMIFYSYFEFEVFSFLLIGFIPSMYMIIQMYISESYE